MSDLTLSTVSDDEVLTKFSSVKAVKAAPEDLQNTACHWLQNAGNRTLDHSRAAQIAAGGCISPIPTLLITILHAVSRFTDP